ncbi:DUF6443 domain-containing protein [Dysgonomonas mossii]|uniref:DUF6443 domain-containing protein n=1 Tax=Dysgonomonas mossii TaxID=163665 RepID=UPI003995E4A1
MKQLFIIISFYLISLGITSQVSITLKTPQTAGGTETACQTISLLPGFSFKATSTSGGLTLRVNPSTCDPYAGQASSVSASQNYIQTKTYTADDGSRYMEAIQYFDGLGRPVQTVQRGVTPQAADLVTYQEYDPFGREDRSWLPAVAAGNNGAYMPLANYKTSAMATYRSTTYNTASDSVAYSRPVYEASPLNRVLEQYAPGADWKSKGKSVKTSYFSNIASVDTLNCILYTLTDPGDTTITVTRLKNYDTGQLYVTRIADEDGYTSFEFKDKLGQVVLTRQILREGTSKNLHDTYYIYDDFGNLRVVLPPLASDQMKTGTSWTSSQAGSPLRDYAYLYKYDPRNRCIRKRLPGTAWVYYVYDKADRLIFTQDGEQRAKTPTPEWTFNKYDAFGRLIISGIYRTASTHEAMRTTYSTMLFTETPGSGNFGYSWTTLANIPVDDVLLINYYDDYEAMLKIIPYYKTNLDYNTESGYGIRHSSAKGLLVGTRVKLMGSDGKSNNTLEGQIATAMYYDTRGRLIQTKSTNHLGGLEKEYIAYNFTGQPTKKMHVHTKDANGGGKQTELYTYTYDHAGRLLTTTHQLTDGTTARQQVTLADNTYDELGRLKYKQKGGLASSKTTYGYNIRSWTKSITSPLFSQTLYYNDKVTAHTYSDYESAYNGNISGMEWQLQGESKRSYRFKYDNLSRLLHAAYNGVTSGGMYNTSYIYDKHGNIMTLVRRGKNSAAADNNVLVDQLTLRYNGNQMVNVLDNIQNFAYAPSADFKDVPNAPGVVEYTYNKNGAMNKDLNKGITEIQYNSLNLPRAIEIANPSVKGCIKYTYSAAGVKLRTVHETDMNVQNATVMAVAPFSTETTSTETTDYVGNVIYKDNVLNRILVDGGYIEGGVYHYYMTDHLGNNRVVVNASGTLTQRNHYYPFGTAFAENAVDEQKQQPYKYNGKELDQMHGLNLYDYSARYYESAVGRFTTVDPHAENYYNWSPYSYALNNPVNAIDPDGRDSYLLIWFSNDGETGHAGIAMDNYVTQAIKDKDGNVVKDNKGNVRYETVKDGTMTYYDLWPYDPVGKTELQSDVKSDYSKGVVINSLNDLLSKDPTTQRAGNVSPEGRAADGIIQFPTSLAQDIHMDIVANLSAGFDVKYNASTYNCSTFAQDVLNQAYPSLDASQNVKATGVMRAIGYKDVNVVAPNNLYNAAMQLSGAKNIKGPKSVTAKPYLQYFGK